MAGFSLLHTCDGPDLGPIVILIDSANLPSVPGFGAEDERSGDK